jgi:hypothetical protein
MGKRVGLIPSFLGVGQPGKNQRACGALRVAVSVSLQPDAEAYYSIVLSDP